MNVLDVLRQLPDQVRNYLYAFVAIVGLALGATQAGFIVSDAATPGWLKFALGAYGFVAGAVGITAKANINRVPGGE